MEQLAHGQAQFRTALMTLETAKRFAKCLAANSSRFTGVMVEESRRAKAGSERRWVVVYQPVSEQSVIRILAQQQKDRLGRADEQGHLYIWVSDPDREGTWMLLSCSGEVYEVTPEHGECSCPDHQYRCKGSGLRCKHLLAFDQGTGTFFSLEEFNTAMAARQQWQNVHGDGSLSPSGAEPAAAVSSRPRISREQMMADFPD